MNILFLHRSFPAQFKYLTAELAKNPENKVVFVTNSKNLEIEGIEKVIYTPENISADTNPQLQGFASAIAHGKAAAKEVLKLKQKGFKPDVIYGHSGWGVTMFMKEIFPDTPLICYFEWFQNADGADIGFLEKITEYQKESLKYSNAQVLKDLENCDGGISPTNWQKKQFPAEFQNKINVIYDGLETDFFKPDENASFYLKEKNLTLTKNDKVITYATRGMEPYRGFPQFMEAVEKVLQKADAHIIIAGEDKVFYSGEKLSYKELMLEKLNLNLERVHFVGALTYLEYLKLLQISSVHVYLTVPYVLSWSLMDALSVGCCIVASSTKPVKEVIKDNYNGLLVDFFDTDKISKKLIYAIENQDNLEILRQNARKTILENYDLKNCLASQIEYIKRFIF